MMTRSESIPKNVKQRRLPLDESSAITLIALVRFWSRMKNLIISVNDSLWPLSKPQKPTIPSYFGYLRAKFIRIHFGFTPRPRLHSVLHRIASEARSAVEYVAQFENRRDRTIICHSARALGIGFVCCITLAFRVQASPLHSSWVDAWYVALQEATRNPAAPGYLHAPEVSNATVREIVRPTIGGTALRLHISNRYGTRPLRLGAVSVGEVQGVATVKAGSLVRVTFSGRQSVVIPARATIVSDPISRRVIARQALAVSLYVPEQTHPRTWHKIADRVNYLSTPGDHTMDISRTAYTHYDTNVLWLSEVDVRAQHKWALVAIGDSITDGLRATLNANQRWTDFLSRRLRSHGLTDVAVLNAGISGNRLTEDSVCYGESLLSRFHRDALLQPGTRAVIVLIGINDINFGYTPHRSKIDCDAPHTKVSALQLIAGYRQLINEAHAQGVSIFAGTITPAQLPPKLERIRRKVNTWIRSSGAFDGIVDFDAALSNPRRRDILKHHYDSGDHIHPSDAGDAAMARAVSLSMVRTLNDRTQ